MGCTVGEAQERIGAREFVEWSYYEELEPDVETRTDFGLAALRYQVAAMFGAKEAFAHYLPPWLAPPKKAMTGSQIGALLRQVTVSHNAYVHQQEKRQSRKR